MFSELYNFSLFLFFGLLLVVESVLIATLVFRISLLLGIRVVGTDNVSRFNWWIVCWLNLIESTIGILTLGYLMPSWSLWWFSYSIHKNMEKRRKRETRSTHY